jgi:hypothetical protein
MKLLSSCLKNIHKVFDCVSKNHRFTWMIINVIVQNLQDVDFNEGGQKETAFIF